MVWKPFRFRHQSRWTPRRNNLRRNKKPGNSGFFIVWRLAYLKISGFCLSRFGCTQASNFFRISEQRAINLNALACLNHPRVWIRHYLAENPQRTFRQIQLRKLFSNPRSEHRSTHCRAICHADRAQNLAINRGIHHFYLDHRLNHASAWRAGRTHPPTCWQPD